MKPIFIVSDLHAGDGSCRDSFAYGDREAQFEAFLNYVTSKDGQLVIAGDLLELWQSSFSAVITHRLPLLNRLERIGAIYILGNHDAELLHFPGTNLLNHPLIFKARRFYTVERGGNRIDIIHGHEADPFCISEVPGIGRITAIITGIAEDKHRSPMASKYKTVATKTIGPMDRF